MSTNEKTPVAQAAEELVAYHLVGASSYSQLRPAAGRTQWKAGERYECSLEDWSELRLQRTDLMDPMFLQWGQTIQSVTVTAAAMSEERTGKIVIHHGEGSSQGAGTTEGVPMADLLADDAERDVDLSDLDDDENADQPRITTTHAQADEGEDEGEDETEEGPADTAQNPVEAAKTVAKPTAPRRVNVVKKASAPALPPAPPAEGSETAEV